MVKVTVCDPYGEVAFPVVDAFTLDEIREIREEFRKGGGYAAMHPDNVLDLFIWKLEQVAKRKEV